MSFVMEVGLGFFLVKSRISDFFQSSDLNFLCIGTMLEFAANHLVANVWWKEDYQRYSYDGVTEPTLRTTWLRVKLSNSTPQELLVLAVSLNNPQKNRPFRQSWLSWTLKFSPRFRQMCSPTYWSGTPQGTMPCAVIPGIACSWWTMLCCHYCALEQSIVLLIFSDYLH